MRFAVLLPALLLAVPAWAQTERLPIKEPGRLDHMRKAIVSSGFECPEAILAWDHGLTPIGPGYEAFCGKGDKVVQGLHYALYPKRRLVMVCSPSVYSRCGD